MLAPALSGFLLGGSLIVAIGAQNAFILRMGLLKQHVFWLCLFCSMSDAALIVLGVAGLGTIVDRSPMLLKAIALFGAAFLFAYALMALRRALNPGALQAANAKTLSLSSAIAICASLTWLNPHVYLDTVVLVGGFSAKFADASRIAFGMGAVTASFVWFFSLGYGARLLIPVFSKHSAWRILDTLIAVIMVWLGSQLLFEVF